MRLRSSIEAMLAQFDLAAAGRADQLARQVASVASSVSVLNDHVDAIQPVRVDMARELADDIVAKIHGPLTLPREFSDWIRGQTRSYEWHQTHVLGAGYDAGRIELTMRCEGALGIRILDQYDSPVWAATFVPPGQETVP